MPTKRALVVLLATILAGVCTLAGCGNQQSTASTTSTSTSSSANSTIPTGITTMAEYLSKRYDCYDDFDKGIQSGEKIPRTLELFAEGGTVGRISDPATITATWNALKEIRIDTSKPKKMEIPDDDIISFIFDSGEMLCAFPFCTTSYASFTTDDNFPVEDPSKVQEVYDSLSTPASESLPKAGDELKEENGAYFWDANDDGTLEHMWFDFNDNGDEAPSTMTVRVFGGEIDANDYLDAAYSIESVVFEKDDKGPYVLVTYAAGDYYGHDAETKCTIRLVGTDKLEIKDYDE